MEQVKMRAANKMVGINEKMKRRDNGKMRIGKLKTETGRDADLVVVIDCQVPANDLIVHFL